MSEALFYLVLAITILAVVGHGIWVFVAAVLRMLGRALNAEDEPARGTTPANVPANVPARPTTELDDLAAMRRQIDRLQQQGLLPTERVQELLAAVQSRTAQLRPTATPPVAPAETVTTAEQSVPERFAALLTGPRPLTTRQQQLAAEWYAQLSDADLDQMPAAAQFETCRWLATIGRLDTAFTRFDRLLELYKDHAGYAATALTAAQLAANQGQLDQLRKYLALLETRHLSPNQQLLVSKLNLRLVEPPSVPVEPTVAAPQAVPAAQFPSETYDIAPVVASSTSTPVPRPPATTTVAPPPPPEPAPPRRSFAEVLGAFMEDRNIRWGELVGGLLIVGSSIALVISRWESLQENPFFQFLIFVLVNAALFAVGLYTHHRWKLESTSRGVLTIATLLVPLVAFATVGAAGSDLSWLAMGVQIGVLLLFAWPIKKAATVLVPDWSWQQTITVAGCAGLMMLVPAGIQTWQLLALAAAATLLHSGSLLSAMWRQRVATAADDSSSNRLLILLGTGTFAWGAFAVLLVVRSADRAATVDLLAGYCSVTAAVLAAVGLSVWRGAKTAGLKTAGTSVALVGMGAMVVATWLAWPDPRAVMVVGGMNTVALIAMGLRYRAEWAHALAAACLAAVYLTGVHWALGNLSLDHLALESAAGQARLWWDAISSAQSGTALVVLFIVLAAAGESLARWGRMADAKVYFGSAVAVMLISLLVLTARGIHDGQADALRAMIVFGIYGAGCLALNIRWQKAAATYLGVTLLVLASLWGLWYFNQSQINQLWGVVMAAEALLLGAFGLLAGRRWPPFVQPSRMMSAACGILALALAGYAPQALNSPWPAATLGLVAAAMFCLAMQYRHAAWTWIGSILAALSLFHGAIWSGHPWPLTLPGPTALLIHATITTLLATAILRWNRRLRQVLARPLMDSGLASSTAAIVGLLLANWQNQPLATGWCLCWLAAIWLWVATIQRSVERFAVGQSLLALAALSLTAGWLLNSPSWLNPAWFSAVVPSPWNWQAWPFYIAALAGLSLAWSVTRVVARDSRRFQTLIHAPYLSMDQAVYQLTVVALAVGILLPLAIGLVHELNFASPAMPVFAGLVPLGGGAVWIALGALVVASLLPLWERFQDRHAECLTLLLVVPAALATVTGLPQQFPLALQWGLAATFVLLVAAVLSRDRLHRTLTRAGARLATTPIAARNVVALAVTGCVLPTAALAVALIGMGWMAVPLPGTGLIQSMLQGLGPLLLLTGGLVALGRREQQPAALFGAGLMFNLAASTALALALPLIMPAAQPRMPWLTMVQCNLSAAAIWSGVWLLWLAPRVTASLSTDKPRGGGWLAAQISLLALGNGLPLLLALLPLVILKGDRFTGQVGNVGGWITFGLFGGVYGLAIARRHARLRPELVGALGMGMVILLACTVSGVAPDDAPWSYRVLSLGWAMYALAVALAAWWSTRLIANLDHPAKQTVLRLAAIWVRAAGISAVLLGMLAPIHGSVETLWGATAIIIASIAGAVMAVWRQREGWSFTAGLGVNVAASMVAMYWSGRHGLPWDERWLLLLQANLIATAGVALAWLAARGRMYAGALPKFMSRSLLSLQIVLALTGAVAVVAVPLIEIVNHQSSQALLQRAAQPAGWFGWMMAMAALAWYLKENAARLLAHAGAGWLVGTGVLAAAACTGRLPGAFVEQHALAVAWLIAGALLLIAEGIIPQLTPAWLREPSAARHPQGSRALSTAEVWVTLIAMAVAAVSLLGLNHVPFRPWWPAATLATASLLTGVAALIHRRSETVYLSGALATLVALPFAWRLEIAFWPGLALYAALALAVSALIWMLLHISFARRTTADTVSILPPFEHLAAVLSLILLATVSIHALVMNVATWPMVLPRLSLLAVTWGVMVMALVVSLWDRRFAGSVAGLFAAGLVGIPMALAHHVWATDDLFWTLCGALAGFVLLTAMIATTAQRLGRGLRLSQFALSPQNYWYLPAQTALIVCVTLLSLWIPVHFSPVVTRLLGAAAMLAVLLAAMAEALRGTAMRGGGRVKAFWQHTALLLLAATMICLGWAWPDGTYAWLYRNIIVMAALTAVAGLGLIHAERARSWTYAARRMMPALAGLAGLMLAVILWQEFQLYQPGEDRTIIWPAIIAVATALMGLLVGAIVVAVSPRPDPFGLSPKGRQVYVYLAEFVAMLMVLHFGLTIPKLFALGFMEKYWTLIAMAVAFVGAGLSEWFERRRLPVLSQPLANTALLLPMLPVLGHWLFPPTRVDYIAVLFLVGLFYGLLAMMRRSFWLATLAGVALNTGLWFVWDRQQIDFTQHPQLWLIPPALAVLVAEWINRRQLTAYQSTAVQYLTLAVIYVSSTADLFISHVDRQLSMPLVLVLMVLSIAGVLAGIMLRVRSFLFLGVTFLLVDVCMMIYHATRDLGHTWVLWISGIVAGAAIIALFAVFEKRRNEMLLALERFKEWR